MPHQVIGWFIGPYRFLSNFYVHESGHCAEILYQAKKALVPAERDQILSCGSPRRAKYLSHFITIKPAWDEVRVMEMTYIVAEKFQIPDLAERLLATNCAELIEGNTWHDNFWGVCRCKICNEKKGLNFMGTILESVRNKLRKERGLEPCSALDRI